MSKKLNFLYVFGLKECLGNNQIEFQFEVRQVHST